MGKYSIIIPTMWKSTFFKNSIIEYLNSNFIDEIIIIDNDPKNKFEFPNSNKIKYLSKGTNIFVNPAWNWGVKSSKNENIIIANDDVMLKDIDGIIERISNVDYDIIGLDYQNINKKLGITIIESEGHMKRGFGCFMFLKKNKYFTLPNELKIFYGDIILYNSLKKRYKFACDDVLIELSKTIKNADGVIHIIETNDKPIYEKKYKHIYPLK